MANKRKFENDNNDDNVQTEDHNWKDKPMKLNPTKHTLDSDEEDNDDDGKEYNILDDDAIEGQEDGIVGMEGEIQITPFNMKEEMEEGHFDTDGMYHWKKEKQIRDNWLENIDWVKIKPKKEGSGTGLENDTDSNDSPSGTAPQFDDISIYSEMLELMKPKETVAKALRRISGPKKNISSAERWKRKKAGIEITKEEEESKQNVSKLTELANRILQNTGNMDVYQESYEFISDKVQSAKTKRTTLKVPEPELDMYADDFDSKEKERLVTKLEPESVTNSEAANLPSSSGVVTWEFKWNKDSEEVSGPHSSEEMLKWTEDGRFSKEVWVRKCGQGGDFYTSKRIDFDLYI